MKIPDQLSSKYVKFLLILSIVSMIIYSCTDTEESEFYERKHGIYYIELDGSPSQMGHKLGMAFKNEIRDAVKKYKQNVYKTFGDENGKLIIDWALTKAGFTNDLKEYLPNVYKEIESIAAAAELPIEDILLINMDKEITYAAPKALNIKPEKTLIPVSTIIQVQREDEEKFCVQNSGSDNLYLDGTQLVIRYKYPNREILIYTFIGRLGGFGVNDKGLSALAANLPQGKKRKSDGLGVNYMLRLLLEQDDVENALAVLKKTPRLSSSTFAIADYKQSVMTEESGDQFVSSPMLQYPGFQCHTNHMLWIETAYRLDIQGAFENGRPLPGAESFYTAERLEQAKAGLVAQDELEDVDDDALQDIITRHNINETAPECRTLQSTIIEYDEDDIDMIISAGSNPKRKWNRYDF